MHFSQILLFVFSNKHVLSRNASILIDREGALQELQIAMHLQILILERHILKQSHAAG